MTAAPTGEIGSVLPSSRLIPSWAQIDTENAPEPPALQWPNSIQTYSRMRNDTQIESLCNSITMPVMRLNFEIDPNGARDEVVDVISTDLGLPIAGAPEGGSAPRSRRRFRHDEHLTHSLLALWYGHMFFEQVPDTDRFDLAKDGWRLRKLAPRMPGSLSKIHIASDGGFAGVTQHGFMHPSGPRRRGLSLVVDDVPQIPVDALAAYVWKREGANWRGRSMLRPLYGPWVLKDRALRVDALKNERFGMGIPVGRAPAGGDPAAYARLAQDARAAENGGLGLPQGADFGVEGVRGTLPDVLASIRYYDESMARSFMAMVVQLGQTQTGSRALGDTFSDFFQMMVEAVADWYVAITNEHVIEDIVDWNWSEDEPAPLLKWSYPGDQEPLAVEDLVNMVSKGIITVDAETEAFVRQRSNLPPLADGSRESIVAGGEPDGTAPGPGDAGDDEPLENWAREANGLPPLAAPEETPAATSTPGGVAAGQRVVAHLPGKHNQKDHGRGVSTIEYAAPEEWAAAKAQAEAKIAAAPVPSAAEVTKAREDLATASRAGGDSRGGSSRDRRRQRENLFNEFGGKEKGYVVDFGTGMKMHWTEDPEINSKGYPVLERGKIFTKTQGGAYRLSNLLPESFVTNRSRNATPVRQENLG